MNINPINANNESFQAKIKMSSPKTEVFRRILTVGAGASMVTYGSESLQIADLGPDDFNSMVESLPDNIVDSHRDVLVSGTGAQATTIPESLWCIGSSFLYDGAVPDGERKIFFS